MIDLRLKQYTRFVHPLLSVYIPFMFITVVGVILVGSTFAMRNVQLFPPFFPLILLLAGVAETITGNMLHTERVSGVLPRLRELILVMIVSLGLILLFFGDLTGRGLNLARANIWLSLIVVVVQWLLTLRIHTRLRDRELFLSFFADKEPRTFQEIYATHNHEGGNALEGLRSVRKLVLVLFGIAFAVLILLTWGAQLAIAGMQGILVFAFFASFFLIASMLERSTEMLRVLASGHVVRREQVRQKNATMILLFAFASLVTLPLVGREAWLPADHLASAWDRLVELLTLDRVMTAVEAPPGPSFGPQEQQPDLPPLGAAEGARAPSGLAEIFRYVGFGLLGLLAAGFLAFLVMPIVRMRGSGTSLKQAVGKAFQNLAAGIRGGWAAFVNAIRRAMMHGRRVGRLISNVRDQARAATVAREAVAANRARISKEERKIHGKVLKAFMRFVRWARRHDVAFDLSLAPREFSEMVASRVPDQRVACLEIADIFEEIVYSHHEIGSQLQARYHEKVTSVVRSRA